MEGRPACRSFFMSAVGAYSAGKQRQGEVAGERREARATLRCASVAIDKPVCARGRPSNRMLRHKP